MAEYSYLPAKPQDQSDDFAPLVPTLENTTPSKGKFVPVCVAKIVPLPWHHRFVWTTSYGRPWVRSLDVMNKGLDEAKFIKNMKDKSLSFQVIIYQDVSAGSDPKLRYIYSGDSKFLNEIHKDKYMRIDDLTKRLGDTCIKTYVFDRIAYHGNRTPFRFWNGEGVSKGDLEDKDNKSFYQELLLSSGEVEANDDQLFSKYCNFAAAATYSQKEPWSILARFFDKEVKDIELHFRVGPLFEEKARSTCIAEFEKLVDRVKLDTEKRASEKTNIATNLKLPFVPKKCTIHTYQKDDKDRKTWEGDKQRIGHHPLGLYEVWTNKQHLTELSKAGLSKPSYAISSELYTKYVAKVAASMVTDDVVIIPFGDWGAETRTTVTKLKVNAARNMKRHPDQVSVMNKTSPIKAANICWDTGGESPDVEWLHRSAFSYGGLREREPIQSSQCSENLILGTSATNTAMIRVEEFIKRYVVREQESVVVTTRVKDEGNNLGCKASDKACWLAPTLEYEFAPEPGAQNTRLRQTVLEFNMLERLTPLRFDFEVGRLVEAWYYGWEQPLTEDEFETEKESGFTKEGHPECPETKEIE